MTANVVHCKKEPYDVYIGRPTKWGNPFKVGEDGDHAEVVRKYRIWAINQPQLHIDMHELTDKTLGCWCIPDHECHGCVLKEMSNTPIASFDGPTYRFLSNFYPCSVEYEGRRYSTTEHAYQAAKFLDKADIDRIQLAPYPRDAKRIAKELKVQGKVRPDWQEINVDVMRMLLIQKFTNDYFKDLLLRTGNRLLMEGNNWHDYFWGVCKGKGQNMLGRLLMEIRYWLRFGVKIWESSSSKYFEGHISNVRSKDKAVSDEEAKKLSITMVDREMPNDGSFTIDTFIPNPKSR